jgi:hypothetical protein
VAEFNEKFMVAAAEKGTVFRRPRRSDLNWIFTVQTERMVAKDNTVAIPEHAGRLHGNHPRAFGRHGVDALRLARSGSLRRQRRFAAGQNHEKSEGLPSETGHLDMLTIITATRRIMDGGWVYTEQDPGVQNGIPVPGQRMNLGRTRGIFVFLLLLVALLTGELLATPTIQGPNSGRPGDAVTFRLVDGAAAVAPDGWRQGFNPDRYKGTDYAISLEVQLTPQSDGSAVLSASAPGRYRLLAVLKGQSCKKAILI